jgi:hypothetical protein
LIKFEENISPLDQILKSIDPFRNPSTHRQAIEAFRVESKEFHSRLPDFYKKIDQKMAAHITPRNVRPSFFTIMMILFARSWRHFKRKPIPYYLYLFQVVFIGAFGCILYDDLSREYWTEQGQPIQKNISNRLGSVLFIVANCYFTVIVNTSFGMVFDRKVILKEIKDGWYSKNVWFLSKIIGDFFGYGIPIWITTYPVSQFSKKFQILTLF